MRRLVYVLLVVLLLPAAAAARGVEVTLAATARNGEASFPIEATGPLILCVTTPCVLAEARTQDGVVDPSLMVDVPLVPGWWLEGFYTDAGGDLELASGFPPGSLDPETFDSTTLLVGLQRRWRQGRWRPFVVGALGATTFETGARVYERPLSPGIVGAPADEEVLAASLAGGVLVDLGRKLAARLEARALWHDLPDRLGGAWEQSGVGVGLTYRF